MSRRSSIVNELAHVAIIGPTCARSNNLKLNYDMSRGLFYLEVYVVAFTPAPIVEVNKVLNDLMSMLSGSIYVETSVLQIIYLLEVITRRTCAYAPYTPYEYILWPFS